MPRYIETDIPARLDHLPWSRWHWKVVIALGITWLLDGLEVTLVGAVGNVLVEKDTLALTTAQVGWTASAYLIGAVIGALVFGRLTDKYGRKKLFFVTLALYLVASFATAFSTGFVSFMIFRALTGAGIGGEYSAINAAIDELLPARVRGRADLAINGTYWLGAALGSLGTLVLLDPHYIPTTIGWRLCFAIGASLGVVILFTRRHLPESPRWLMMHGRVEEADAIVKEIEAHVHAVATPAAEAKAKESEAKEPPHKMSKVDTEVDTSWGRIVRVFFIHHRKRAILGLVLMMAQAFAYNGVFFTYPFILKDFCHIPPERIGLYMIPFAIGNLLGPILLGHLFDVYGRRIMISSTYTLTGVLLAGVGGYFAHTFKGIDASATLAVARGLPENTHEATVLTLLWCVVFFFASAAASSAYLTVSELFPVELRGMAIAIFYAAGTGGGGVAAPAIFGALIGSGQPEQVLHGYLFAGSFMVFAGIVAAFFAVAAEGKSLEELNEMGDINPGHETAHH